MKSSSTKQVFTAEFRSEAVKLNYLRQSRRFIAGAPQRRWVTRDPPKGGYSPNFI